MSGDGQTTLPAAVAAGTDVNGNPPPTAVQAAQNDAALDVINHLLWHKSLIDEADDGHRLDEYFAMVRASESGEHLSITDPFNKSIALAFELVLQNHLNPWKIDLGEFSRLYLKRAQEEELELVTAGRIILMAWTVLKLQSDAMLELAERLAAPPPEPEPEMLGWDDIRPEWGIDEAAFEYTQRVKHGAEAPIDEKIRRQGSTRKVTLMELVEAFEEVRREADERKVLVEARERIRSVLKAQADAAVRGMMHTDDPEAEQALVWMQILARNGIPIPLSELHEPEIDSFVAAFNSVLFLAADNKIELWQENFPYGPIMLRNLMAAGHTPNASDVEARAHEGPTPNLPLSASASD